MLSIIIFGLTLSLLAVAQPTLAEENVCADEDKGFKVGNTQVLNWIAAQQYCISEGLTLVSITSESKTKRLQEYLSANNYLQLTNNNYTVFWTSGTRQADDSTWVWFTNGVRASYMNWLDGEPNNKGGNEKCIAYDVDSRWNDADCEVKEKYPICESPWAS